MSTMEMDQKKFDIDLTQPQQFIKIELTLLSSKKKILDMVCRDFMAYSEQQQMSLPEPINLKTAKAKITTRKSPCGQGTATWSDYKMFVFGRKFEFTCTHDFLERTASFLQNNEPQMKRRVAVLLAYIGEPFYGLQYQKWNTTESRASIHKSKEKTQDQEDINTEQPQTSFNTEDSQKIDQTPVEQLPTIEKTLIDFFYEKELLKESNKLPDRCHLRRACRTDKGVSAAFNIVSLCLEKKGNLDDIDLKDVEYFKNTFSSTKTPDIDDFIYFHKLIEVPKSFCPKLYVTHRVYSYLLPKYIFPGITIGFLQQIFNFYKGTHNFHNFTKKNTEKGTKRYIMDILVLDDQDFYDIQIKGQSFMMHQIRKMIGLVALVLWHISDSTFARSNVLSEELKDEKLPSLAPIQDQCMAKKKETINDEPNNEFVTDSTNSKTPCLQSIKAIFDHTLSPQTHNIPKAPSTYLFLRYCDLDLYNRKCKNNKKNTTEIVIDKHQIDEISEIIKKYLKKDKTLFEQWKECIKEHINEYLPFLHG